MMIGDAMTPFDPVLPRFTPRFTVDVTVFEVKFDVTVFEVKFVEVDVNFFRFNLPLSINEDLQIIVVQTKFRVVAVFYLMCLCSP